MWRAWLAMLALAANIVLPGTWSVASPLPHGFGDTYSLCLASGGVIVPNPDNHLPNGPVAGGLHCSHCLFTGTFAFPATIASEAEALTYYPAGPSNGYAGRFHGPRLQAFKFQARAPPA